MKNKMDVMLVNVEKIIPMSLIMIPQFIIQMSYVREIVGEIGQMIQ